jgi:transposase
MALSIQKCWEIVFLHLHRLGPKLSLRAIAKELQCSQDTVQTWIVRYQETGDVQDKPGSGRKRKTSEIEDKKIITMVKKQRTTSSATISMSMDKQGVDISSATVRRQLYEKGLYKLQPLKKPLLSDTHRLNLNGQKTIGKQTGLLLFLQMRQHSLYLVNQKSLEREGRNNQGSNSQAFC